MFAQNLELLAPSLQVLGRISVLGSAVLGVMALAPFLVEGVTHLSTFRGFARTSVLILVGSATNNPKGSS